MANPILARELRARSRRVGTTVSLTLFMCIMTGVAGIVWATTHTVGSFRSDPVSASTIGTNLFDWVIITMIFVMSFIIPGFTGSSISGERDRQTLVPMQVSLLTPRQIIFGKLQASLAYTGLLLSACVPLFAIAYVIGGITVTSVMMAILALAVVALLLGALSILASTLVRRTGPATVLAYAFMLTLVVGLFVIFAIVGALTQSFPDDAIIVLNPLVFVGSMTRLGSSSVGDSSVLRSIGGSGVWWASLIGYAVLIVLALSVAVRRVRIPNQSDR